MKAFRFIGMALFAVFMCVNFASCSNDGEIDNEPQKAKEYIVSLGFTGEISVSESPLSRTSNNDLYGFAVTCCPDIEGKNTYEAYAYGLFDDVTSIDIKLLEGYKYRFAITMIRDGKNVITETSGDGTGEYKWPFMMSLQNKFIYSKTPAYYIEGSTVNSGTCFRCVADRYYGVTEGFIPSEENNSVNIYMKRVSFGAKFIAENLTEGELIISMDGSHDVTNLTPDETTSEKIYTLAGLKEAYKSDEYIENVEINILWEKSDGVKVPLGDHIIGFKRNKLTTITIKVADLSSDKDISIELEDEEMGTGDNITIENGKIVDTNVGTDNE